MQHFPFLTAYNCPKIRQGDQEMAVNFSKALNERYELLTKSIEDIDKKIKQLPEGWVNVRERNGKAYYYLAGSHSEEKYLSCEESKIIGDLLQKNYLKEVKRMAKRELDAIGKMRALYPAIKAEDIYDNLPEGRKRYVVPITLCDEAYAEKWMNTPYRHKPFKKNAPEFYTAKGERVRSKSEVIIADRLAAKGIPYRYECPLKVRKKTIHPDFTILRMSDRRILYHEHCGKMDDPDYKEDMVERVNDYSAVGIILGDRLFCTFESDNTPFDVRTIDRLIDMHFR